MADLGEYARLTIVSDSTGPGTELWVGDRRLAGVTRVVWEVDAGGRGVAHLTVNTKYVEAKISGDRVTIAPEPLGVRGHVRAAWAQAREWLWRRLHG